MEGVKFGKARKEYSEFCDAQHEILSSNGIIFSERGHPLTLNGRWQCGHRRWVFLSSLRSCVNSLQCNVLKLRGNAC